MLNTIFNQFEGTWAFERSVVSFAGEALSKAQGTACFKPDEKGHLAYEETGQHEYGDFSQDYTYTLTGDDICVYRHNGELFQRLMLNDRKNGLIPHDPFVCNKDVYTSLYYLTDDNHFTTDIKVEGKNYR